MEYIFESDLCLSVLDVVEGDAEIADGCAFSFIDTDFFADIADGSVLKFEGWCLVCFNPGISDF